MADAANGVGPFEAEDVADGFFVIGNAVVAPESDHFIEFVQVGDLAELAVLLHGAIPRELALSFGPGLLGRHPVRDRRDSRHASSELGGDAETDFATAHFGKGGGASSAAFPSHTGLSASDLMNGETEVAVKTAEGVETEVEVSVEGEHGGRMTNE
jgi:hypothetical protein